MKKIQWQEILGWNEEQLEEVRFAGFLFLREGKYEDAILFFEALHIVNPQNAYDAQILGALYLEVGDFEKALPMIDIALQLEPEDLPSQLNKVKTLLSIGQKKEGLVFAKQLTQCEDPTIASDAEALLAAHL